MCVKLKKVKKKFNEMISWLGH